MVQRTGAGWRRRAILDVAVKEQRSIYLLPYFWVASEDVLPPINANKCNWKTSLLM